MRTFQQYRRKWDRKIYSEQELLELNRLTALVSEVACARLDRGWSQEELARRAQVDKNAISRLESKSLMPSDEDLKRIAYALGINFPEQ
jgi:ribosome-binding protein aMBF1 (putative translation factor)